MSARLPIETALPALLDALRQSGRAVLQAPPGAGKTTRVPLAVLEAGLVTGRIVMLQPRRLAARAAAERMADMLGEPVGQTVGYAMRGARKVSDRTRIEVVTEGLLTRYIQSDPALSGVGMVIFDEIHERSLNADFGLALCLEIAGALRDDLMLIAMSATLDAEPIARAMAAPVVTSQGRSFPVDIRWLNTPVPKDTRFETAVADLVAHAVAQTESGVLVFLPGEGEIRRVASGLSGRLPAECIVRPLFGALPFSEQRAAIRPETHGRKVVLSTSIAETSLTIEDIRVVVDAGRARRARFDPGSGMSRLVTEPVTRAEATQRSGRAGRVAPGVAFRMWTKGGEGALPAYPAPEIAVADLAPLALDCALWGAAPADLPLLTQPPEGAFAEARALLTMLGALDGSGRITDHGRALAALPLHPRLGHMLMLAGRQAAPLAALLNDRDPLQGAPSDLGLRLAALKDPTRFRRERPFAIRQAALDAIRADAKRLERHTNAQADPMSPGAMAALAFPDRIGLRRNGDAPRYLLSGGKGAVLPPEDPLAGMRLIVATDLDGNPREARIRQALSVTEQDLRALFGDQITWQNQCIWSRRENRVVARQQERLGALALDDRVWKDAPPDQVAEAMLDGVRQLGLNWSDAAGRFAARVVLARAAGRDVPAMDDESLLAHLEDWLLPHLDGVRSAADWRRFDILPALRAMLDWPQTQMLDRDVPGSFETPLGRKVPIDYSGDHPSISVRVQEVFGQTVHPTVAGRPLRITLLSPAQRPVQTTLDLPGFWASSYADVRKDMRSQYPKHPWPEDPRDADPTLRAKRRKQD